MNLLDRFTEIAHEVHPEIEIRVSEDYPYAAWQDKENYDSGYWEGHWFNQDCKFAAIYLPAKGTTHEMISIFFHELGHVQDYYLGLKECEVNAWKNARKFQMKYNIGYNVDEFKSTIHRCLGTYIKDRGELFAAIKEIVR